MASGTVCYRDRAKHEIKKTKNVKTLVDRLVLDGFPIVWVDVNSKVVSFHPFTPVREILKKVDGLCSQGVFQLD